MVHGTLESLQKFFADAVSHDYEIVAILSEEPEKISFMRNNRLLEVLSLQNLPDFVYDIIDGIIFTAPSTSESVMDFLTAHNFELRKVILWDAQNGWQFIELPAKDAKEVIYFCGLEFHLRNEDDAKFFNQTLWRLQGQWQIKNLNPQFYPAVLAQSFKQRTGKNLDFNNLRTFTEKMQWLKIYDATPLKSRLADKYLVRNWVAEKIGEEYLIPLLGVWDDFDDINFDYLPAQFVLKCNHGSGMNIIVRDKKILDVQRAREKINAWLAVDYGTRNSSLELHYTRIDRKIIAEKFMTDGNAPEFTDYKFVCFDGKAPYCKATTERSIKIRCDYFDENWKHMDFERNDYPNSDHPERIPKPKNFELMKKLAAKLSEGFAFVRVDFYEINGKVYFGEMTFTPGAGNFYYKSKGTDEYLGSLLKLPKKTPLPRSYKIQRTSKKFYPLPKIAAEFFFCYYGEKFYGGITWRGVMKGN